MKNLISLLSFSLATSLFRCRVGYCSFFKVISNSFFEQRTEDIQGSKPSTSDRHSIAEQPFRVVVFVELSPARHF